jgi:hypothetical protein
MLLRRPLPRDRALAFLTAGALALLILTACDKGAAADTDTPQVPSSPAAVAQVIDSLETSNDSTKKLLDETRIQLDTALQGILASASRSTRSRSAARRRRPTATISRRFASEASRNSKRFAAASTN